MQRIEVVYHPKKVFERVARHIMSDLEIPFETIQEDCIIFKEELSPQQRTCLAEALQDYAVRVLEKGNGDLIAQIKDCIRMVVADEKWRKRNISAVLSDKLGYNYSYLSTLFSTETFTSIENFYIFSKIESSKELLMNRDMTLTEVAYKLGYSSAAHLSRQFKSTTGLTVTQYLKFLANRTAMNNDLTPRK